MYWKKWAAKHKARRRRVERRSKVDRRKRDFSMLIGRISVNVKLARRRKAQRSTNSTTAHNGTKLSGKEVLLNILSVEVNGTGAISV